MPEYIEKQHLLDFLDAVIEAEKEINSRLTAKAIQCSINVMSSKDVVERKRGVWFDRGSMSCRCSNCGCKANKEYSFCPNCGADMRDDDDIPMEYFENGGI